MALSVRDLRAPKLHEIVRAVKLGSLASRSIGQSQISISSKVSAECSMIKQRHITHTHSIVMIRINSLMNLSARTEISLNSAVLQRIFMWIRSNKICNFLRHTFFNIDCCWESQFKIVRIAQQKKKIEAENQPNKSH